MAVLQLYTRSKTATSPKIEKVEKVKPLSTDTDTFAVQHERWIDFCALGGMMVDEAGNVKPTTVKDFAIEMGVSRETLYYWKKAIPDFNERVKARMKELGGQSQKLAKAWNGIWLKTCAGNAEAGKLYFTNFDPDFKMPVQKNEMELGGGFAELMAQARRRRDEDIQEGEVVPQKAVNASNNS